MCTFSVGAPPLTIENEPPKQAKSVRSCELASDVEARGRGDGLVEARRGLEVGDADPEVIDDRSLAQRAVVHRFGAVAVRVEEERPVVVVAVLRTQPGAPSSR